MLKNKRMIAVFILFSILLSFAMPNVLAATEYALETYAYDTFVSTNGGTDNEYIFTSSNIAIASAYVKDAEGNNIIPGYGWSTNWVVKNDSGDGYTDPTEKITFTRDTKHTSKYYNFLRAQSITTEKVYRFLKNPITFTEKDAAYEFSVDISMNTSNRYNGIRYYIGDTFYIGFEGTASGNSDNKGTVTPLIGVNGTEVKSETSLSTGSGYEQCEFVTYTVTLELDADGVDTITLTAKDGESVNSGATYEETVATVSTTADITGVCNYIAFEAADSSNAASVDLYGFYIKGAVFTSTGAYDIYPTSLTAEEKILPEDYSNGVKNSNIAGAYTDANEVTGTGWKSNWLVKDADDTDYREPVDDDKVCYAVPTETEGQVVYLKGMPAGTKLYRLLKTPIQFKDTYGKYTFSADIKNSISSSKSNVRFNIGDVLSVGYNKVTDKPMEGTLVIEAGEKTFTSANNIVLANQTSDASKNFYMHFEVEISLEEEGEDIIKLSVTPRDQYNRISSEGETTTIIVSADLNGTVEYVGFGSNAKSTHIVDNISVYGITAAEIDSMMSVVSKNGEFKSGKGEKLLDTSKIIDSVVYDFELFNYYRTEKTAKVYFGIYYDGKLAGVKSLPEITIPKLSNSGNLTVGFDDALPEGDKSNISVKVFVWEGDTLVPFGDSIDMYSQNDRSVIPQMFGADTDEKVTVAFMGDSITHLNPSYTKWIEYYYRIKYPTKDIKFVSKGISGDSASGIEKRFDWDILNGYGTGTPTEACLMIGMNDVSRSLYPDTGTDEEKQEKIDACLGNIEDIAELCEQNDIKLTLITPPLYDEAEYSPKENLVGVNAALGKVAEGVIKLANERNLAYIDFYGYINNFNSKLRSSSDFAKATIFNVADRVHATPAGTFAEGFLFIAQQLDNPVIASVDIDASSLVAKTESATVTNVEYEDNTLSYTYSPQSLPMFMTEEYILCNDTYGIPVTDSINREIIKIAGLEEGSYKIVFDNSELGIYTAKQLAEGVNIATVSTNPGYVQSETVYEKVTSKMAKDRILREIAYVERNVVGNVEDLTDVDACIAYVTEKYADSDDTRYINYASNKAIQETTVSEIAVLEAEAKTAAEPKSYDVKIIKQ